MSEQPEMEDADTDEVLDEAEAIAGTLWKSLIASNPTLFDGSQAGGRHYVVAGAALAVLGGSAQHMAQSMVRAIVAPDQQEDAMDLVMRAMRRGIKHVQVVNVTAPHAPRNRLEDPPPLN